MSKRNTVLLDKKDELPQIQPRNDFFVYVIESPSPSDLYHKRYESDLLEKAISLDGLHCVTRLVTDRNTLSEAVTTGLIEIMENNQNLIPLIHLSMHGNESGLQLTSGEMVDWDSMRAMLLPINKALQGNLILCISACEGWAGCTMAMDEGDLPFFAIVSSYGKPSWSDTAVAFATFYHLLARGQSVPEAIKAMKISSGNDQFTDVKGEKIREIYCNRLKELKAERVREALKHEQNLKLPAVKSLNTTYGST